MKKRLFTTLLTVCSLSVFAQRQIDSTKVEQLQTVELTSTKFKLNPNQSGKVVLKLTATDLKQYQGSELPSLLNQLAGINIIGTQSFEGQNLSYNIRGGSNRQVLILIDGIAISNPSSISNDYDLRLLPLDQIESIEIIKGAASALYGSGAATAVINIKLKSASKDFSAQLETSVATNKSQNKKGLNFENYTQSISISQPFKKSSLYWSFQNNNSTGMSAAKGIDFKPDPFSRQNLLLKYQLKAIKHLKLISLFNYNKFNTSFDGGSFTDAENLTRSKEIRAGLQAAYKYAKGDLNFKSAFNNITNNNEKTSFPSINKGNSLTFDVYNRYHFNQSIQLLTGINAEKNKMTSFEIPYGENALQKVINQANFTVIDPYVNFVLNSASGFNFNLGGRLNHHSTYGSHFVYTVNPSYHFKLADSDLKLMATYSTAYIVPTLFQLFSPNYGFHDLKPEDDKTLEGGFTWHFKNLNVNWTYFYRQEQNFIDFVLLNPSTYQSGYRNSGQNFYTHGVESNLNWTLFKQLVFSANYTLTKVADTKIRIPKHKFNAHLSWEAQPNTHFGIDFNFTDKRTDSFFDMSTYTSTKVTLKSYTLVNLQASRSFLNNRCEFYANLTNIFNVDYQELVGFTTRGRNILLGFKLNIN